MLDYDLAANARIIISQFTKLEQGGDYVEGTLKGTMMLCVAEVYDYMTAMKLGEDSMSTIQAMQYLRKHQDDFGKDVVDALFAAIQVLVPGVCVQLTNGDKAAVIRENLEDVMRPVVLSLSTHEAYDLADPKVFQKFQVKDVMKTMDNRYVMDRAILEEYKGKLSYKRRQK